MKILVLVGSDMVAQTEARINSGRAVAFRSRPVVTARLGDTEVCYVPVRQEHDIDRLRGVRFDLIIEDGSFNPECSFVKGELLDIVRRTVLR